MQLSVQWILVQCSTVSVQAVHMCTVTFVQYRQSTHLYIFILAVYTDTAQNISHLYRQSELYVECSHGPLPHLPPTLDVTHSCELEK